LCLIYQLLGSVYAKRALAWREWACLNNIGRLFPKAEDAIPGLLAFIEKRKAESPVAG
jgi:hypothetical protein